MGDGVSFNLNRAHLDTFAWIGVYLAARHAQLSVQPIPEPRVIWEKRKGLGLVGDEKDDLIRLGRGVHVYLQA